MNLLLDLGNTRLKAARLADGVPCDIVRLPLADAGFDAAFDARLRDPPSRGATGAESPHAWLAAVAPEASVARVLARLQAHAVPVTRVTTRAQAFGITIAYAEPSSLGVDRFLNLVAARRHVEGPVLVASVGTALTIDGLLADGTHLGGLIAASPEAARAALVARAPRLDVARGQVARFAADTADAIESGTLLAATALIERSLHELERRADAPATLLLTGGGAAALRPWLTVHRHVEDLALHGLAAWALAAGG